MPNSNETQAPPPQGLEERAKAFLVAENWYPFRVVQKEDTPLINTMAEFARRETAAATDEVTRLRAALEHYANVSNWATGPVAGYTRDGEQAMDAYCGTDDNGGHDLHGYAIAQAALGDAAKEAAE